MKRIAVLLAAIVLAVPLLLGCGSSQQKTMYRTAGIIGVTAESAMAGWAAWVNAGKADADEIATVKDAWEKYQAAYKVLIDAGKGAAKSGDTSALTTAWNVLVASEADLVNLIIKFLPADKAAALKSVQDALKQ